MSIEGQGHFFTIYFPGFVCFVLYLAKISGERLQDHWSSGFLVQQTKILSEEIDYQMSELVHYFKMSRVVRKPAFCICENKDADQLRSNREADQRLCFRYTDSTIPLLPTFEISCL